MVKFNKHQLKLGTKVELEHTKSRRIASKIAKDHLREFPDYYTHLIVMEKNLAKRRSIRP